MDYSTKKLPKSELEINVTVTPADYKKQLENATKRVSAKVNVKGFRKGNVPLDVLIREVGEMTILQEATNEIIQNTFLEIIKKEELETVGSPKIDVEKIAPNNDFVYKATVALLPKIKIVDPKSIKVKRVEKEITSKHVDETLETVRKMQAKEIVKDNEATADDKIVVDMDMFLNKVPVDGGQSKDYQVYLNEPHYVKGFNEELVGLKKGDEKEFSLKFPKEHYQKMLAGQKVDFKIKVKEVFERQLPELNDDFAKKIGQESVEKLRELIKKNLQNEEKQRAEQATEIEILDKMIEKSKFAELPKVLVDSERNKIFYELQKDLEKNGISIDQYLSDLKKTEKEIMEDFTVQAEKRAKASLLSREIAKEYNIKANDKDIDAEIEMMKNVYKHNSEYMENLKRPEVRDSITTMLQNKKVMSWLKEQTVK
jgi:trigger factor